MFIWHLEISTKNLYLGGSLTDQQQEEYKGLLNEFYDASGGNIINDRLRKTLDEFVDKEVFTFNEGDLPAGYIGFYRWCVTNSPTKQSAKSQASALWEYLWGALPVNCLADPPQGELFLNEDAWQTWIKNVCWGNDLIVGEEDEAEECEKSFPEGKQKYWHHRRRERNSTVVAMKKNSVSSLVCEVCGFDFEDQYGELGRGYAECHHVIPLSNVNGNVETKLSDLAILCSNCHRMIHRNGVLDLATLRGMIRKTWENS